MKELVFEVLQESDGGYTAEAIGESIFTQAGTWEELKTNAREPVQAFYFDSMPLRLYGCGWFATKCWPLHEVAP